MGFKPFIVRPFAKAIARDILRWSGEAVGAQQQVFRSLMQVAERTSFGKEHQLRADTSYDAYRRQIPIRDYEGFRPYIDRIVAGEQDVLWKGRPVYFAKTSGTTSGVKFIPITRESLPNHFTTARNALFNYYARTGNGRWMDGKVIFLSGSPELHETGGILTGRLSGISNHLVPAWLKSSQLPSYKTNCIEDWEQKLEAIVSETLHSDMRLISGIPPWVQMYYERLLERSGKKYIKDIFPNYSVFVYGGVNFEPYRSILEELVGKRIDSVETFPASEGFLAFQDEQGEPGLLLNVRSGIFFEFVPAEEIFNDNPKRLSLAEVEPGVNYAMVLSTNAGLWAYDLGDTVRFVSTNPYRVLVTGRVRHYISAFGEHVIGKEVEEAFGQAIAGTPVKAVEFTVAPQISPPEGGPPYHEWLVEFETPPGDLKALERSLDRAMTEQNIYYRDLIEGKILSPARITPLQRDAFRNYMKTQGKLGGQNKVPRLSNDRKIADDLQKYKIPYI